MHWPSSPARPIRTVGNKQVFIGLDFGTTFTKVSYRVAPVLNWRVKTLKFPGEEDELLLPSVVWVGPDDSGSNVIRYDEPTYLDHKLTPVRYFKYSMVLSGLTQNRMVDSALAGTTNKLRIVSAFFLGVWLNDFKSRIAKTENLSPGDVEWFVNLGIPAGTSGPDEEFSPTVSDQHVMDVFLEVLNVAWELSLTSHAVNGYMSLAELDRFYENTKDERKSSILHCVPELYAEVLLYYQDKNVSDGIYCVVDVGGGTFDIALFYKRHRDGVAEVSCIAHAVAPLGFEAFLEKVSLAPLDEGFRKYMSSFEVPPQVLRHEGEMNEVRGINPTQFSQAIHSLELAVGSHGLNFARMNSSDVIRRLRNQNPNCEFSLFLLGGGGNVKLYDNVIGYIAQAGKAAKFPGRHDCDILEYVRGIGRFEITNNSRILISQMLAQPFNEIPELNGSIWHLSNASGQRLPAPFDIQSRVPLSIGMRLRHVHHGAGSVEAIDEDSGRFDMRCDNDIELSLENPRAFEIGSVVVLDE